MHKKFDNISIEKKWQEKWKESGIYEVGKRDASKEKEYVLVEWPYPSGNLHIGHWHAFAVPDIYVRYQRMKGKQVLYPMGFDAFGLPAENAAIKRNINPKEWTEGNIAFMRTQLESMGSSFSWDKTTSSTDASYYKWTQWMFTEFFKKDIAFRGKGIVNWCSGCNTVIANEQVLADDTCERCGTNIEKKEMPQWMIRITKYADRLIDDLDALDWPEHIKEAQRQWIGRSQGAEITFKLSTGDNVPVFTTRPDTLFGATYLVLAPEHTLIETLKEQSTNKPALMQYIALSKQKSEQDRLDATKEKTGVKIEGVTAINPASGETIPVYIADYVLAQYGTGAIMAVPAHDERDFEFAKKFGLHIKPVVRKVFGKPLPDSVPRVAVGAFVYNPKTDMYLFVNSFEFKKYCVVFGGLEDGEDYTDAAVREVLEETGYTTKFVKYIGGEVESHFYHPGKKINRTLISRNVLLEVTDSTPVEIDSEELSKHEPVWLSLSEAKLKMNEERDIYDFAMLENESIYTGSGTVYDSGEFDGMDSEEAKIAITEKVGGKMMSTYRLRNWSVGRQRYWGVPIPIVYDPEGNAHPIPKENLPWFLPEDVDFRPTGEPPLAKSNELKERTEQIFGKGWTPEVETLDTFVDSSWYFLRYIDNQNDDVATSLERQKEWMPIDMYFGGAEHTTMHLLYSRFWQKALFDLGLVQDTEPYKRRINRGLILGPDGNKMSKSKGNVIDPDDHVKTVGADSVKMYLAFMGPYGETANYPWDMGGIAGVRRFLERVYGLSEHLVDDEKEIVTKQLHKTIEKLENDIVLFKFNTAISAMMIFINLAEKEGLSKKSYETFIKVLAPFAPHLTEELWEMLGNTKSVHLESFPTFDATLTKDNEVTIGVQINGKMRGSITIGVDATQEEALIAVQKHPSLQRHLEAGVDRIIYIQGKILNVIVQS
jgi:leucyl-tRNA synthetase